MSPVPESNPYASPQPADPFEAVVAEPAWQTVPCPQCGCPTSKPAPYNPDRGRAGPRAIDHVICTRCAAEFHGETGRPVKFPSIRGALILAAIIGVLYIALLTLGLS